ncbi:protein FAM185A [Gadus macrocephalus]|uniref:protein FAM185A n=1 Tax=Gadus macrocephalus TaxID=80720 RepID=UPI0028CB418A|nr:protein FAM185A [Gadus macrocephalus]
MFWSIAGRCVGREFITACQKTISLSIVNSSLPTTFRTLSTTPCTFSDSTGERERQVLGKWDFVVDPYCTVLSRLGCSVAVRSLDPHDFPQANQAFIVVYGSSIEQCVKLDLFKVHYDSQNKELSILADRVTSSDITVELTTSVKSNLNIVTHGGGAVHIQNMECDVCKVQTGQGSCTLQSVKGHEVEVHSDGGHVTGIGTIHGNVNIRTSGDGAVDVKKLQGTVMHVSTERGPLKVKAIYAESTSVSSSSGTVELGHVHGEATVKSVSGDVIINGSSGSLDVWSDSGNIDAYVGESGSAKVFSQSGSVCVRVPSSLRARADLVGASVEVSPEVTLQEASRRVSRGQTQVTGYVNGNPGTEQSITAEAGQGVVTLKTQSWFQSLRLQGS